MKIPLPSHFITKNARANEKNGVHCTITADAVVQ